MATLVQPAFPYVDVIIDTSALAPAAQRAPGVVAVVGNADGATAPAATPLEVTSHADAIALFGKGTTPTALSNSLDLVLAQDPRPTKIYGVRTPTVGNYAAALAGLEAADDVTFVCLAGETAVGTATTGDTAATGLRALAEHVENSSNAGNRRVAVAMIDPSIGRTATYVDTVLADNSYGSLKSASGRMILVAARGATTDPTANPGPVADAAAAVMGAIAGHSPATSVVLKQVRGFSIPVTQQYVPAEVTGLSGAGTIPLIDPALIPGTGLFMGDGGTFSTDPTRNYVDIVRVLDDIEFRLRAGLVGTVGDARITKAGLTAVRVRVEGILGPLRLGAVIDDFSVAIPLLRILTLPENARTTAEQAQVVTTRQTRDRATQGVDRPPGGLRVAATPICDWCSAAATGVPVVARDLPVLREVLAGAGDSVAFVSDVPDIATALDRQLTHRPDPTQGRHLAATYTWHRAATAHHDFYTAQIDEKPFTARG